MCSSFVNCLIKITSSVLVYPHYHLQVSSYRCLFDSLEQIVNFTYTQPTHLKIERTTLSVQPLHEVKITKRHCVGATSWSPEGTVETTPLDQLFVPKEGTLFTELTLEAVRHLGGKTIERFQLYQRTRCERVRWN